MDKIPANPDPSPLEPPSGGARARIEEAALACFVENGFEGTTIAQIARRAGASPATIYLHYTNKQALFDALQRPDLRFPPLKAQERRQGILAAALQVFSQKGYAQASLDEVAEAAGITKGAIYGYFDSKDELLAAIIDSAPVVMGVAQVFQEAGRNDDASVDYFMQSVTLGYLGMFRDPTRWQFMRLLLSEGLHHSPAALKALNQIIQRGSNVMSGYLARFGYQPEEEVQALVQAYFGMLFTWVLLHQGDEEAQTRMAERTSRMFLHGIEPLRSSKT
jgi:AcrR family transcriptional regulator